jgi:glycosyltransferase involved in cell wall biosynthesis
MIIGLFPELLSPGGVQRTGHHLAAVLAGYSEQQKIPYRFLSLNDPSGRHQARVGGYSFTFEGYQRAKLGFSLASLHLAISQPRLVVAGHPNLAPVARAMQTLAPRLRTVIFTHGIEVWTPLGPLRRRALRRATVVVAPSADTARKLVLVQGVRDTRVRLLPWALDPDFAAALQALRTNHLPAGFPQGRVVLAVGRWMADERYKGLDTLIRAVPRLLPAVPDLYLVAVGDGDDRPRLEELAREEGVADRVRFLASLAREELMTCYAHCDVFALPSAGEGFGLVFLEAMASGKPVVGGAHGGSPEVLEEGVTGHLVPHGDVERLASVMRTLLADEGLRRRMGEQARLRVEHSFSFDLFQSRLTGILEEAGAAQK